MTTQILDQYRRAEAPLRSVIDAVPSDAWGSPSPCEGWTAADVIRHLIDAQRDFLSARGFDLPATTDVDADPAAAWAAHRDAMEPLLADEAAMATGYDGHFGPTTVGDTIVRFYVFDMVAHRWDLATATGQSTAFSDAELDQLEAGLDGFGEALYMPGVCKPGVTADDGTREARVLARMGRAA